MPKLLLLLFLSSAFFHGCKTTSTTNQTIDERIVTLVGSGYTVIKNESSSFALCTKQTNVSLDYAVVRISDMKTVLQESIAKGSVTWNSDLKIQVNTVPGIIKKDELGNENNRIIDLSPFILHEN